MQTRQMDLWNEALLRLPQDRLSQALKRLNAEAVTQGTTYRVWEEKLGRHAQTFWQPDYPRGVTSTGLPFLQVSPNLSGTPITIGHVHEESLRRLGRNLYHAVGATRSLVESNTHVWATIGRSHDSSEMDSINAYQGYVDPRLMRIDYIWVQKDDTWYPVVLDINLLPGYLTHTRSLYLLANDFLGETLGVGFSERYRLEVVVRTMLACYDQWVAHTGYKGNLSIAHVVREGHGLVDEHTKLIEFARGLEPVRWGDSRLVFPSASTEFGKFSLAFRQVREFWSRANPATKDDEEAGIRNLIQAYQHGEICVFPPFALWQEDHQWFHWYRTLADEFSQALGSHEEWEWFRACLPKTAIVSDGALMTEDGVVPLDDAAFKGAGVVIKRGDSTSCRDLRVLTNVSGGMRREAIGYCKQNWPVGLVWQEFLRPTMATVVALNPEGVPFLFTGKTKYSAYFVGGEYIGGNVMVAQANKVHGGSGTLIAPVLTMD